MYFLRNYVECLITQSLSRLRLRSYFPFLRAFSLSQIFLLISAAESGWGEKELKGIFLKSLSEELKDELASREEPNSLEA